MSLGVANASFIAQGVDWMPEQLYDIVQKAFHHRGFSFVRIIQRCPEFLPKMFEPWLHDPGRTLLLTHANGLQPSADVSRIYRNQREHDPLDIHTAREIASLRRPDPGRHPVPRPGGALLRGPAPRRRAAHRPS